MQPAARKGAGLEQASLEVQKPRRGGQGRGRRQRDGSAEGEAEAEPKLNAPLNVWKYIAIQKLSRCCASWCR